MEPIKRMTLPADGARDFFGEIQKAQDDAITREAIEQSFGPRRADPNALAVGPERIVLDYIVFAVEDRIAGSLTPWELHAVFPRRSDAEIRKAVLSREEIPGWPGGRREARVVTCTLRDHTLVVGGAA